MPVASVLPADPDRLTFALPRDVAMRLRALLVSRRDHEAARLAQLVRPEDAAFVDDHSEISATVASAALHDVEHALARFDDGSYGSCEVCREAIPIERLEVIPHATTCVGCAMGR